MKSFLSFVIMLFLVFTLFSCATSFSSIPNEPQFLEARNNFHSLVEEYNLLFREADFDSRLKLKKWLEPQIYKTKLALFSWDIAIQTSSYYKSMERERKYLLVNSKLLDMIKEL